MTIVTNGVRGKITENLIFKIKQDKHIYF
jgi:hypothetical protein